MATNLSTVGALEHVGKLIDELNAWNRVIKKHAGEQKKQSNEGTNRYVYDPKKKLFVM